MSGLDLKWKIFSVISVVGCVLLFFLGYNLGSLNEDARANTIQQSLDKANGLGKARLERCRKTTSEMKNGIKQTNSDLHVLNVDLEGVEMENDALADTHKELKEDITECQALVAKTQSTENNLSREIEEFRRKILELELILSKSSSTQAQEVKVMKGEIRALRLENEALRIRKLQREVLIGKKKKEVEEWNRKEDEKQKQKEADKQREIENEIKRGQEYLVSEIGVGEGGKARSSVARVVRVEEEEDAPPRRRRVRREEEDAEEEETKPRRKRYDDEEEYEERPKRRSAKKKYSDVKDTPPLPKRAEEEDDELLEIPARTRKVTDADEEAHLS